ncbi:MAG: ABC transporter permease [Parabacteroides sp.]
MWKIYLKQALQQFKENPLVTWLSVAGTALAVAVLLVLVLVFQINLDGFAPESKRDRFLYVFGACVVSNDGSNNGTFSVEVLKECFYTLKTPEAVCGYTAKYLPISLPEKRLFQEYEIRVVDAGYWQIFDHQFVEGSPFTEADFQSGVPAIVLSEETARQLFGQEPAVGRDVVLEFVTYRVCGVVKEVPNPLMVSYGQAWVPYSCFPEYMQPVNFLENVAGSFSACILARSSSDFQAIRDELQREVVRYNSSKQDVELSFPAGPISQLETAMGSHAFRKVDWRYFLADWGSTFLFLLLVPALNLIGVIQSSLQKRIEEIGLRRAFGATRGDLVRQILAENLVLTLIGAIWGIGLSFGLLYLAKSFLFNAEVTLTASMLIRPTLFGAALVIAFLLNLLSAIVPAWHIMRQPIVEALAGSESEKK